MRYVELVVDMWFLVDVVINFFTGYHEPTGEYVSDRRRVARAYLRSWFVPDFLSSLPADFIADSVASTDNLTMLRLVRMLRMARLLKLFRLTRLKRFFARVRLSACHAMP